MAPELRKQPIKWRPRKRPRRQPQINDSAVIDFPSSAARGSAGQGGAGSPRPEEAVKGAGTVNQGPTQTGRTSRGCDAPTRV